MVAATSTSESTSLQPTHEEIIDNSSHTDRTASPLIRLSPPGLVDLPELPISGNSATHTQQEQAAEDGYGDEEVDDDDDEEDEVSQAYPQHSP